jgi:hypothetical protein
MNENLEDLNGKPEDRIPISKGQEWMASSGYTCTCNFNFVPAGEWKSEKISLWQRFLNLFKRNG